MGKYQYKSGSLSQLHKRSTVFPQSLVQLTGLQDYLFYRSKFRDFNLHSTVCSSLLNKKSRTPHRGLRAKKQSTRSRIMLKERRISHSLLARSITQTVLGITAARFKIGHTPRKLPDIPPATFRFIAYLLQSCKYYYTLSSTILQGFSEIYPSNRCRIFDFRFAIFYLVCTILSIHCIYQDTLPDILHFLAKSPADLRRRDYTIIIEPHTSSITSLTMQMIPLTALMPAAVSSPFLMERRFFCSFSFSMSSSVSPFTKASISR